MRPWALERGGYDRPIPRRIVEEAGIPRDAFGQIKRMAAMPHVYSDPYTTLEPDLESVMSPAAYRDFQSWREGKELFHGPCDRLYFRSMHAMYRLNIRTGRSSRVRAAARSLGVRLPATPVVPVRFAKRRTPHRWLFHWGMERLRTRYSSNLSSAP
jgi:hypothetical protein